MKTKRNLYRDLDHVCVYEWHINNKLNRTGEYNYRARRKLMMKFYGDIKIIYYVDPLFVIKGEEK